MFHVVSLALALMSAMGRRPKTAKPQLWVESGRLAETARIINLSRPSIKFGRLSGLRHGN